MRTRDVHKEDLVRRKAIELIVQEGIEHFSMNRLARDCGISVGTLYIYYRDKEDLIIQLGREISKPFFDIMLRDFSPDMPFRTGLLQQWKNRAYYNLTYPLESAFVEIIRHTPYQQQVVETTMQPFKDAMWRFVDKSIKAGELIPISSIQVFWSIAYGPLYILLRFHHEKKGVGNEPFQITDPVLQEAFDLVLKALTPTSIHPSEHPPYEHRHTTSTRLPNKHQFTRSGKPHR